MKQLVGRRPRLVNATSEQRLPRLWLGALVAALSPTGAPMKVPGSFERSQAFAVLSAAAAEVHITVGDAEHGRCVAWLTRLGAAVDLLAREESVALAASALVWAAVSAWQDLGGAPWTRCAASAARLARKLEPDGADTLAPRMGDALRRAMNRESDRLWLGFVRSPLPSTDVEEEATAAVG